MEKSQNFVSDSVDSVRESVGSVQIKVDEHNEEIRTLTYKLTDSQTKEKHCNLIIYRLQGFGI